MRHFGLRFTTGHLLWAATLVPAVVLLCMHFNLLWLGITLGVLIAVMQYALKKSAKKKQLAEEAAKEAEE